MEACWSPARIWCRERPPGHQLELADGHPARQFDDRTFWIFFLYIAALVLVQQTMTTIFTRTGLPWPSTLGGFATAAALLVAAPLVRAVLRRRLTARAESGSDNRLHGLVYVLSLLPAAELPERLTGRSSARRRADGTEPGKP
jgi:hypothetical protein